MSANTQEMQLQIKPVTAALGAEVWGIDITKLDDNGLGTVNELILEYGALSLHGQGHVSTEQLRKFGLRFGKLDVHGYARTAGGFDDVMKIGRLNESWHSDLTWKQLPAKLSMLYAHQTPEVGGDTLVSSQYKAYEDLSDAMKSFLEPLEAEHEGYREQPVTHPIVIRHPETGRKALYVNGNFTRRITHLAPDEGQAVLEFLFRHCSRERYQSRIRYEPGTLGIWDNRCVQHCACPDFAESEVREMHRVSVLLDSPPSR